MGDSKSVPAGGVSAGRDPTRLESVEELRLAKANAQAGDPPSTLVENIAAPTATRLESIDEIREAMANLRTPTVMESVAPPAKPSPVKREGTRIESAEEIRKALKPSPTPAPANDTVLFRPARRPPTAVLVVYDDGATDGERHRLRNERTVIGRAEGDVRIPHDGMMSTRHAEIVREAADGRWRWLLVDLQSTNGSFVRVANSPLKHKAEFLVGSTLLRFEDAALNLPGATADVADSLPAKTQGWQALAATDLKPSLVQVLPQGLGKRFFLAAGENWIGRDGEQIALGDDVQVAPRHAKVVRDAKGNWSIADAGSLNGVWLRIERHEIDGGGEFQLGEQRFAVQL